MTRNPNPGDMQSEQTIGQACADWQPLLMLLGAGDELDSSEQARIAAHLATCPACSAALAKEKELLSVWAANRIEPDAALLASCRAELNDSLDREEDRSWFSRVFGSLFPTSWLAPRPAWSAAILLLIGFTLGIFGPRLLQNRPATKVLGPAGTASNLASPAGADTGEASVVPTGIDLHTADVAGINVQPSNGEGPEHVEVQLKAQQPVTVQGTVDDAQVKNVLLGILAKGDRICPDIRLDAVECLRERENDPAVRSALCRAVRQDHNAAVRLKAVEALQNAEPEDQVRGTLLDALMDDQNPGVRVEAINALRGMTEKSNASSDDRVVSILRDRMQNDPNTYIRLQSAATLGELGPRAKF